MNRGTINPMPDKSKTVLAVDIGSSRIHIGIIDTGKQRCLHREDFERQEVPERLPCILDRLLRKSGTREPPRAIIAGGRDGMAAAVKKVLSGRKLSSTTLCWHRKLPVRFRYKKPELLGADRIAHALFAAAEYPDRNVVIISAGTAITVDAVTADHTFAGGVILPGAQVQLDCLHASTVLPRVAIGSAAFPGTSTESCMRAGVTHGIAGALSHFVKQYRALEKGRWVVLATGGGWPGISGLVDFKPVYLPDLTLVGIGMYGEVFSF